LRFTNRVSNLLLGVLGGGKSAGDVELNHKVIKETVDQLLKLLRQEFLFFKYYFETRGVFIGVDTGKSSFVSGADFVLGLQDNITNFEKVQRELEFLINKNLL